VGADDCSGLRETGYALPTADCQLQIKTSGKPGEIVNRHLAIGDLPVRDSGKWLTIAAPYHYSPLSFKKFNLLNRFLRTFQH